LNEAQLKELGQSFALESCLPVEMNNNILENDSELWSSQPWQYLVMPEKDVVTERLYSENFTAKMD
jgi:hypothetical protein